MYSKELLQPGDLQPFLNQPETLINQSLEFQLAVANYLQTPRQLLEVLVNNSRYPQVVEAAKLHINLAGEIGENWREVAEIAIKNAPLEQNDLLNSQVEKLEAFKINIDINKKLDLLCFLVGKINNDSWFVISPSTGQRKKIPHWISYSDLEEYKDNSIIIFKLESTVEKLLATLSPLKLGKCYPDGHGYLFKYYYSYAFAKNKVEAFVKVFNMAKILQIKRFISLSSDYHQNFYNDDKRRKTIYSLNRFFQQKLSNTKLYHFAMYDNDYTYILGETPDKDWQGVKISRSYRYFY